jgi:hypothetical protein
MAFKRRWLHSKRVGERRFTLVCRQGLSFTGVSPNPGKGAFFKALALAAGLTAL